MTREGDKDERVGRAGPHAGAREATALTPWLSGGGDKATAGAGKPPRIGTKSPPERRKPPRARGKRLGLADAEEHVADERVRGNLRPGARAVVDGVAAVVADAVGLDGAGARLHEPAPV